MLYPNCISCFGALTLLCLSIAHANWLNYKIFAYQQQYGRRIEVRQLGPPTDAPTTTSTQLTTGPTTTSTSVPTTPTTKSSATTPTSQPPTSVFTSAPATPSTTTSNPSPNTEPTSTSARQTTISTANAITRTTIFEQSTTVELITSVVTVSGSVVTSVSSSTEITTVPTLSPATNDNSSGISTKTRNTIIGVASGIGGIAIIAAITLIVRRILLRIRERKRKNAWTDFRNEGPDNENMTGVANTRPTNPFQSTLENYHNPARVNASSNF